MIINLLKKIKLCAFDDAMSYIFSLYLVTTILSFFNPLKSTSVKEFKRIIGAGIIADYDCTRVISHFNIWLFGFLLLFIFGLYLSEYLKKVISSNNPSASTNYLNLAVTCGIINNLFIALSFFGEKIKYFSAYLIGFLIIAEILFIVNKKINSIGEIYYHRLLWSAFAWAWAIASIITPGKFRTGLGVGCIIVFASFILISLYLENNDTISCRKTFHLLVSSFSCIVPLLISICIELHNIANQHYVFITSPRIAISFAIIIINLTMYFAIAKNRINYPKLDRLFYPLLLVGITALKVQLPLIVTANAHLFESANYSVLISDFLYFGDIPIVQHYGGHMLTGVIEGIAYGILNNDYSGAVFAPYSSFINIFVVLLFYLTLKIIFDEDYAFLVSLFIPFEVYWNYYGLGLLVALSIISFNNKQGLINAIKVWIALEFCILYRLDLGFAFAISTIITLFWVLFTSENRRYSFKLLLESMVMVGVVSLTIWTSLCLYKDINPITRLLEFIYISLSNQNWAYEGIGNKNHIAFAWCYILIPVITELLFICLLCMKKVQDRLSNNTIIILIMLSVSYFANFSRGLVRHSVAEMAIILISWSSVIFIALMVTIITEKKLIFIPLFSILMIINNSLITHSVYVTRNIIDGAAMQLAPIVSTFRSKSETLDGKKVTLWEKLAVEKRRVDRFPFDISLENRITPLRIAVNELLAPHETYLDMMNRSFMYSALGRRSPVYVAQSPLHLSGEYTQEQFIREIEYNKDRVPLVIYAKKDDYLSLYLDGVANSLRYYKVSEFIYQNYVPLCSIDEFMIWCDKRRYKDMLAKVDLSNSLKKISYGYDGPSYNYKNNTFSVKYGDTHIYNINSLARIWGDWDKKQANNNRVLSSMHLVDNMYVFENTDFAKEKGNYIILEANYEQPNSNRNEAKLHIGILENGRFIEKYYFGFTPKTGFHKYLFRVSCDYYWFTNDINAVYLEHNGKMSEISMQILEGD